MGCIKLDILNEQYRKSELKISSDKKELTFNFSDRNAGRSLFNAKEYDEENKMTYFVARYLKSDDGIFNSRDQKFEKYFYLSPYSAFGNNPLRYVDPNGKDIWDVNEDGKVVNRTKDTKQDVFRRVGADGKPLEGEGNSVTFKYGTIKERNKMVKTNNGEKAVKIFEIKGDENATKVFNLVTGGNGSNKVEWGHVKVGTDGNLLGTSNNESNNPMGSYALSRQYTIRESNHNHPGGNRTPSESDVDIAKDISDKFPHATFNIFVHPNEPIPYNKNSDYLKPTYPGSKSGVLTPGKTW